MFIIQGEKMAKAIKLKKIKFFGQDYQEVKKLYKKSFPKYERINLTFLTIRSLKNEVEFLAIYDEDKLIGFTYLLSQKDLTLILYLAIKTDFQGQGYGSKFLAKLKEYKQNQRLILEIEVPKKEAANYQQRLRRKDFYLKNNFKFSGLIAQEKGEEFEILSLAGKKVSINQYLAILKKLFTPLLFKFHNSQVYLKK